MNNVAMSPKASSSNATQLRNSTDARPDCGVLVVSARAENRKSLLRILEGLPIDAFVVTTLEQAQEVLETHSIEVIFCEEPLPDGSYHKMLQSLRAQEKKDALRGDALQWGVE